jgi:toxin ParE1/3/4
MPDYSLSARAVADLDEILAFTIDRWGLAQGDTYLSGLEAVFHLVSGRPMIGRSAAQVFPNLRRVEYVSHIVFYTTYPGRIRIERVLHKSRAQKKSDFR